MAVGSTGLEEVAILGERSCKYTSILDDLLGVCLELWLCGKFQGDSDGGDGL